jgi:prophage antirepressor-like protein
MNNLQTFAHNELGQVRTVKQGGEPWFVAKDVCEILGYANGSRDVNRHVDIEDRQNYQNGTFGNRGVTIINESGLYALVLSSKLPQAKRFKKWVTSEVLPSIRKDGGYIATSEEPLFLAKDVAEQALVLVLIPIKMPNSHNFEPSRVCFISYLIRYHPRRLTEHRPDTATSRVYKLF